MYIGVSWLPLLIAVLPMFGCASLQRPVPVQCPVMPAPDPLLLQPPQYQQRFRNLTSAPQTTSSTRTPTQR